MHDIAEVEGELFMVMSLYEAETLKQQLEKGRLPVDEAVEILQRVVASEGCRRARCLK